MRDRRLTVLTLALTVLLLGAGGAWAATTPSLDGAEAEAPPATVDADAPEQERPGEQAQRGVQERRQLQECDEPCEDPRHEERAEEQQERREEARGERHGGERHGGERHGGERARDGSCLDDGGDGGADTSEDR